MERLIVASIRKRLAIFILAVIIATLIDWFVINSGFHIVFNNWFDTRLSMYHLVGWSAVAIFLIWLHQGLNGKRWADGLLGLAGGMPLFFVLEDFFYSILISINDGGHYPYPEFIGNWRENMLKVWHPILGKVGAFAEQVWFWDLPAFFYIEIGWSAVIYFSWLILKRRRQWVTG